MKNGKTNAFISQNVLLKAFGHKYIRKIPKKNGKGFWYIYKETFKKPFQALAQIFGIKKATISENYKAQNIERDYGASQTAYAAHVLEYFTNREKWDALFAKEENRKKYRKPQKPKARTGGAKAGAGKKRSGGGKEKKPTDDAIKVNRSLMYKVWKTYGSGAKSEERSRAMEGNQNAKKDGAEATGKPQTDEEMRREKEETEKARKEAGLPPVREDLGQRISLIDDLTRKEDDGKAARKEAALNRIREAGKNKERLRETDIDWEAIEDGSGAAKDVITKANVFGQVDWAQLKADGMAGGAAFLIDKVYEAIADAPQEDTAEARRAYVIGLNTIRDWLEASAIKKPLDVETTLMSIRNQLTGDYYNPLAKADAEADFAGTAEYKEKRAKLDALEKKRQEAADALDEAKRQWGTEARQAAERIGERVKQFFIDNKVKIHGRDVRAEDEFYGGRSDLLYYLDELPDSLKDEYLAFCDKAAQEENAKARELEKERDAALDRLEAAREEWRKADYEFDEWWGQAVKDAMQEKAMSANPLAKSWKELGEKIADIAEGKDKWFSSHIKDAARGEHDDWEWAQKYGIHEAPKKRRKSAFERKVAENYERKGGRDISAKSTTEIAQMFNLRGIKYGSKVDLKVAQWHVRRCAESFADLADITGIPDSLISLNGRVSLAIGANDTKGTFAHYTPALREINMNKMDGGGSLAHEWFHAFDNLIVEAMGGKEVYTGAYLKFANYMSEKFENLTEEQGAALRGYLSAPKGSKKRSEYKAKCAGLGVATPDDETEEHQIKVIMAFDELSKAMREGDVASVVNFWYDYDDEAAAKQRIRPENKGIGGAIYRAGNFDKAKEAIFEQSSSDTERVKWLKMAAAFFKISPSYKPIKVEVNAGGKGSRFLAEANEMDRGKSRKYWGNTREMGARAFAAYVKDKLAEQGRRSDYLTRDDNDERLYPQGEERERINAAFDKLFRVIAETKAIRKALAAVARRKRWLWVDGNGKIWVRKGVLKAWKKAMSE